MSLNEIGIVGIIAGVLTGGISFLAYKFGRAQEKIENAKEKSQTLSHIRMLRQNLDDGDVVKRLHDTFKR